jgi:cytosine/adenosine deaminase-related metal-dependent hydrolase
LADAYFRLFDELNETYNDKDTRILLAPCWAHGASEAFLRRVRAKSDGCGGVMIHMHLLQSPVQKAYGLRRHGKPTVFWLDDLGLVERNVVYGHAIHVTEAEIELMGRRKVSVTSHPSCNFHMRNGITPVMPLRAAGVNVAMGLDDKTINDDEDAVMELRMMHKVHRLHTFDLTTPALSAYEALEIATLNGAKASGFGDEVGALVPGMKGDAILVDLDRVARDPWIDPEFDIAFGAAWRCAAVRRDPGRGFFVLEPRRVAHRQEPIPRTDRSTGHDQRPRGAGCQSAHSWRCRDHPRAHQLYHGRWQALEWPLYRCLGAPGRRVAGGIRVQWAT